MASYVVQTSRMGAALLKCANTDLVRALHTSAQRSRPVTPPSAPTANGEHGSLAGSAIAAGASSSSSSSAATSSSSSGSQSVPPARQREGAQLEESNLVGTSRRYLPSYKLEIGPLQQSRLEEHYHNTLSRDLLYMTYEHKPSTPNAAVSGGSKPTTAGTDIAASDATATTAASPERAWDPSSPYSKNRPMRPNRGYRQAIPSAERNSADVVALDRIVVSAFCKEALNNKQALIPLLAMMRAITGLPIEGSLADPRMRSPKELRKHGIVRVLHAKTSIAAFKLRRGTPVGVQAILPSKVAYEFLEVFTTFVLPRLRTFNGFPLPPAGQSPANPAAISGVVSLGMGPDALSQFPQTEINWDAYPQQSVGFQVDCITNQSGSGATERARQLLSGLGVPFVRRGL